MARLTVISWNIESLSDLKMAALQESMGISLPRMIAQVVKFYKADLLLLMEVSPNSSPAVFHRVLEALNDVQGDTNGIRARHHLPPQEWQALNTGATGKEPPLPAVIDPARYPRGVDAAAFWRTLQFCYDEIPGPGGKQLHLKPAGRTEESAVRDALNLLAILRPDREAYMAFFRCDVNPAFPPVRFNTDIGLGFSPADSGLRSTDAAGAEVGYQNEASSFNGRSPFVVQFYGRGAGGNVSYLPLVLFHAPFGDTVQPRRDAGTALLRLGVRTGQIPGLVDLSAAPVSLICGDFNVPFNSAAPADPYHSFAAAGCQPAIDELSSLKAISAASAAWVAPLDCRASPYDNIVVKHGPGGSVNAAQIIDLVDMLSDALRAPVLIGGDFAAAANPLHEAFCFYRTWVSDHLPAMATITFDLP